MPWAFAEIIRKIANSEGNERVRVAVGSEAVEKRARGQLKKAHVDLSRVDVLVIPTDRGWMRDCGPCFVERDGRLAVAGFGFDAWSKYPEYALDALVPAAAAQTLACPSSRWCTMAAR